MKERKPEVFESQTIWMPFEPDTHAIFNVMASRNCLCKYDDGTEAEFNDENPFAQLTHFEYKKS